MKHTTLDSYQMLSKWCLFCFPYSLRQIKCYLNDVCFVFLIHCDKAGIWGKLISITESSSKYLLVNLSILVIICSSQLQTVKWNVVLLLFSALPFLKNTRSLLFPVTGVLVIYILSLALSWNFSGGLSYFYKHRVI